MLSRLLLVTDRYRMKPNFESALTAALRGGARLVQIREKDLSGDELLPLAERAQQLCTRFGAHLLINGHPEVAQAVGASGVHWSSSVLDSDAHQTPIYTPLTDRFLQGVSVHSPGQAKAALRGVFDYLIFGSIFATQSHPGELPAGIERLRETIAATYGVRQLPVFAIGGITSENADQCLGAGADGIAVIGAAWDNDDVEGAVRGLLATLPAH
jgi:thiamine-phosphate diphosphorylase